MKICAMRKTRERRRRENEEKPKRILIVVDKRETETKWDGLRKVT